jgi:hypothetical protein
MHSEYTTILKDCIEYEIIGIILFEKPNCCVESRVFPAKPPG